MSTIQRICMWSGPRNISTTIMYSFAQRTDTTVYDEPLYAHYLKNTTASDYHPGAEEVLTTQENNGAKVIQHMLKNEISPVQFYKQMTHHLLDLDKGFMSQVQHILLTRDPKEMLPSYAAVIDRPNLKDVGYKDHCDLVDFFQGNNIDFTVIDSKKILLNPEDQLKKLGNYLDQMKGKTFS